MDCVRVGPKSSSTQTKLSEHETNRGEAEKSERVSGEIFEILGQPAAAIKPSGHPLSPSPIIDSSHADMDWIGVGSGAPFQISQNGCFAPRHAEAGGSSGVPTGVRRRRGRKASYFSFGCLMSSRCYGIAWSRSTDLVHDSRHWV